MTTKHGRIGMLLAIAVVILMPAVAGAEDGGWSLRVQGVWSDPDGGYDRIDEDGTRVRTNADSSVGAALGAEYRFSRWVGLDLGVMTGGGSDFEIRVSEPGMPGGPLRVVDSLDFDMWSAGLNFYFTPAGGPQFYAGPFVAQISYSDLNYRIEEESLGISIDDDTGVGVVVGLDVPIGAGRWFFSANGRYIETDLDARPTGEEAATIAFDPLMVGVGFGLRF